MGGAAGPEDEQRAGDFPTGRARGRQTSYTSVLTRVNAREQTLPMRMLTGLMLAILLLIGSAVPVLAKAGASITVPDGLAFGDSFMPTWTEPNGYRHENARFLFAEGRCYQDGRLVWAQNVNLDDPPIIGNPPPFTLETTPSWPGGAASCTVTLTVLDAARGKSQSYAVDAFEVAA